MTEDLEILQGAISAVVYQNYENGYAVLRVNVGGGQNVTVVGTIPLPAVLSLIHISEPTRRS